MSDKNNLPKSWELIRISEAGELLRGVNYKKEHSSNEAKGNYLPVLRANNIYNGELNFDDLVFVDKKFVDEKQLIKQGDIVFAMSSGSKHLVGKSAKTKVDFNGGFGAFCAVFRPNENFNKDFIAYFFQGPSYKYLIRKIGKGTNIINLKREHILDLDFPIPPLPEQHRIVEKIEELFTNLDKGIESLKTAQQQLKVYRQSVLKWAFEGKLTNVNVVDGELPMGWQWKMHHEVAFINPKLPFEKIDDNLEVSFLPMKLVEEEKNKIHLKEFKKYKDAKKGFTPFTNGDVIFAKITPCMENGKCAIVHDLKNQIGFGSTEFHVSRPKNHISAKYIFYFLIQERFRKEAVIHFTGSVGQKRVPASFFADALIPVPPTSSEQEKIVHQIESRLSVCDKIEETISNSLQQAETLRLSILKKAYEGKLVPQNPKDEPAAKLLERIKSEREKSMPPKKLKLKTKKKEIE